MRRLRSEQMRVLGEAASVRQADILAGEVLAVWGEAARGLGEEGLRTRIGKAAARAGALGITSRRGVSRWLHLTFLLGEDFDRDPALPWVGEILRRPGLSGCARLEALLSQAKKAASFSACSRREAAL